jgi:hypothetical protein
MKMFAAAPPWAVVLTTIGFANVLMLAVEPWLRQRMPKRNGRGSADRDVSTVHAFDRDTSAGEAIAYLAFGSWGKKFADAAGSPDVSGSWEYKQFHQAVADGAIPMWGRKGRSGVYEPILTDYWRKNHLDWFELLKGGSKTEPISKRDDQQVRYSETMTSRAATERYFQKQPAELLRAKSSARQLAKLLDEAAIERNKLLPPPLEPFDQVRSERVLVDWNERVLSVSDAGGVEESTRPRFQTLDRWTPDILGAPGRSPEQERLEAI